jgi:hypothetical protein
MGITNRHTQSIVVGQRGITTQLILPDREVGGVDDVVAIKIARHTGQQPAVFQAFNV